VALPEHDAAGVLAHEESPPQIDRDGELPRVESQVLCRAQDGHACAVDQDVNRWEVGYYGIDGVSDRLGVGDVASDGGRCLPLCDRALRRLKRTVEYHDRGALDHVRFHDGSANARRAPGNDGHLACE
jgi:hypothetical protein